MRCRDLVEFNAWQKPIISAYLKSNKAETQRQKNLHVAIFLQYNDERLRKTFCRKICSLRNGCKLKGDTPEEVKYDGWDL